MRHLFFRYFLLFFTLIGMAGNTLLARNKTAKSSAITYKLQGTFEDQLKTYIKAKILSHTCDIPLLYKQGIFFDQLVMHTEEQHYAPRDENRFKKIVNLDGRQDDTTFHINDDNATLYVIHPFFSSKLIDFGSIRKNPDLQAELRHMISPRFQLQEPPRPSNCITVAVCVQKDNVLGTTDSQNVTHSWKFPSDQFYIDQINILADLFKDKTLYVHIFTNDPNPSHIIELYSNAIGNTNITFSTRKDVNQLDTNVLEDLFAMTKYDCLIRPVSRLAIIAEIIGKHIITISPKGAFFADKPIIDALIATKENVKK